MPDSGKPAQAPYPGETAEPDKILALASEFALAAEKLLDLRRKGKPLSQAPFRFTAIHAIELYLNAVLLARGLGHAEVKKLQHDLSKRTDHAKGMGLKLGPRTAKHIEKLTTSKEYQKTRYDPHATELSQLNRLHRTLQEVQEQSLKILRNAETSAPIRKNQGTV